MNLPEGVALQQWTLNIFCFETEEQDKRRLKDGMAVPIPWQNPCSTLSLSLSLPDWDVLSTVLETMKLGHRAMVLHD